MRYAVDSIVSDIALLKNIETKEKKWININLLPSVIHEGSILDENYNILINEEIDRERKIKERFERVKKKN